MKTTGDEQLAELVRQVRLNNKYAAIDAAMIAAIGAGELGKRISLKEAVKTTRNKLHQVGSAFQEKAIPYADLKVRLAELPTNLNTPAALDFVTDTMRLHASTSERLSIHEHFFTEALKSIAPVTSILDLACGLNPLNLHWMPVASVFQYSAWDIYTDMADFLNAYFGHFQINGKAGTCDLTQDIPGEKAQLALLLKTIPCLEQVDKSAGKRLLEEINAENILVSFPAHSLGGRSKGMVQNYEAHFNQLVEGKNWQIDRFEFPGELAFLVRK